MNKKRNPQDKARIVMEFIDTSVVFGLKIRTNFPKNYCR